MRNFARRPFHAPTYPSYNLQPLLLKRYRELEEARAFNNWLGERRQAQEKQRHLDDVSRTLRHMRFRLTDLDGNVVRLRGSSLSFVLYLDHI